MKKKTSPSPENELKYRQTEASQPGLVRLEVPDDEDKIIVENAILAGAFWDKKTKSWYASPYSPLHESGLIRFLPSSPKPLPETPEQLEKDRAYDAIIKRCIQHGYNEKDGVARLDDMIRNSTSQNVLESALRHSLFATPSTSERLAAKLLGIEPPPKVEAVQPPQPEADQQPVRDLSSYEETKSYLRDIRKAARMPAKQYLNVPIAEKDEAKKLGARWDRLQSSWYVPPGVDLHKSGLDKWLPSSKPPLEQFVDVAQGLGLKLESPDQIIADHGIHRVPVAGDKPGDTSGAYIYHPDTRRGYLQNWRSGKIRHWKADGPTKPINDSQVKKQIEEIHADIVAKQEAGAKVAQALWSDSPPAKADHPYCRAKGITNPIGVRMVPNDVSPQAKALGIRIAKSAQEAKELRQKGSVTYVFHAGDLLVPGFDAQGKMRTVQSINPEYKSFVRGTRTAGVYTVARASTPSPSQDKSSPMILAEGYATAHTVSQLLGGKPVVAAFSQGNLDAVAHSMREQYPHRPLLIAADNDHSNPHGNVGLRSAEAVAKKYGGGIMLPPFKQGDKGTDWNDYAKEHGDKTAKQQMERQVAGAKTDAAMNAERLIFLAREREREASDDPSTSADNQRVAKERMEARTLMGKAISGSTEARAQAIDALVHGPDSSATGVAAQERTNATQTEEIKKQRQEIRDGQNVSTKPKDQPSRRRRVDYAAEM